MTRPTSTGGDPQTGGEHTTHTAPKIAEMRAAPLGWQRRGLTYTASGYGHIPSQYRVRFEGETRWRRLWTMGWSNARTAYVRVQGERVIVPDAALPEKETSNG